MSSWLPLLRGDDEEPPLLRDEGREFFEPPQAAMSMARRQMKVRRVASTHRR
jgi:hypothetical protein